MKFALIVLSVLFALSNLNKVNLDTAKNIKEENEINKQALVSFCQTNLSENLKQANVTFTDVYSFKIDENGKPIEINSFRAKYTEQKEIESCIKDWKFSGFSKNVVFHVEFSWVHGVGWTQMRLSSKDFSQTTYTGDKNCSDAKR